MRPLALLAASTLALTAGACGPKVPVARTALDCPAAEGDLTRTGAAADGKACAYVTSDGAEVTLQLVSVQGDADAALRRIETALLANRAPPKADAAADAKAGVGIDSSTDAQVGDKLRKPEEEAAHDAETAGVQVEISKDGRRSVVMADGGKTRIDLPGIHIVADDSNDSANIKVGPVTVNADEDNLDIRMRRDVRLRGEALNPKRRGLRASFIYTADDLPDGYRMVGYEAGGPKIGPLAVAVVRSKTGNAGGDVYADVKKLVRRNGGV
jgi:hypothetical protein